MSNPLSSLPNAEQSALLAKEREPSLGQIEKDEVDGMGKEVVEGASFEGMEHAITEATAGEAMIAPKTGMMAPPGC